MDTNQDSVIMIFSGTLWESQMVKSILDNVEIESYLMNSLLSDYAYNPMRSEQVKVMISSNNFEKAKKIVEEYCRNNSR
jgi:hypothetical protein